MIPVYILIRTSHRPKFFASLMDSIKRQTYPEIVTIVHSDDATDSYVTGDIVLHGEASNVGAFPANVYCNRLLDAIPEEGWYHFVDDDDEYFDETSIEHLVNFAKRDCFNVCHIRRGKVIIPENWKGSNIGYQTESFFLHTDHRDKARWKSNVAGDIDYSRQLTKIMPINWINTIACKTQVVKGMGEGSGMRRDKDFTISHPQPLVWSKPQRKIRNRLVVLNK